MGKTTTLIAALAMALPALPLIVLSRFPEYWGIIYLWWGVIFAILSFFSTYQMLKQAVRNGAKPTARQLFFAGCSAWFVSFAALAIINFTPLCLGKNNGDGTNNVSMCVFLTIIWPVVLSVPVVPFIYLASIIAQKTMKGHA